MDPIRVGDAAVALATALDDHHPGGWQERAATHATGCAHRSRKPRLLSAVPRRTREMVTNHEALGTSPIVTGSRYSAW